MKGNGWFSNINSATDFPDFFWLISKHIHNIINEWIRDSYTLAAHNQFKERHMRKTIIRNERRSKTNTLWETRGSLYSVINYGVLT